MNLPRPLSRRGPLKLAAFLTALLATAVATGCGGKGDIPNDPRVLGAGTLAEVATYAWQTDGAAGLYDFLTPELQARCSREQFAQTLASQEQPTGFRALKRVKFNNGEAEVTFIQIFPEGDREVVWGLVQDEDEQWYLSRVSGSEECG